MTVDNLTHIDAATNQGELEAIRSAAIDYIEAWYSGDAARMESCLHPDLAKRTLVRDSARNFDRLEPISALALVIATRRGAGSHTPLDLQRKDIIIQDVFENIACVRVDSANFVDFLHLGRFDGKWLIVNAIWVRRVQP